MYVLKIYHSCHLKNTNYKIKDTAGVQPFLMCAVHLKKRTPSVDGTGLYPSLCPFFLLLSFPDFPHGHTLVTEYGLIFIGLCSA